MTGTFSRSFDPVQPLSGRVSLVTGASSGIGAAVAAALGAAGAAIGVNFRSDPAKADRIVDGIRAAGGRAVALRADVTREAEVQAMFEELVDAFGRVDILVANAGIQQDAAFTSMSLEQWRQVLDVNLTGQFLCARSRAPLPGTGLRPRP